VRRALVALVGFAALAACSSAHRVPLGRAGATTTTTVAPAGAMPTTELSLPPVATIPPPAGTARVARLLLSSTGVVVPVLVAGPSGWQVHTPCGHEVTLTRGTPVGPVTVVLDPGHGGTERGAIGPNGLAEADLNLDVARRTEVALARAGVTAVLTRDGDYGMPLTTRAEIALAARPRAFLSLHHNSDPDGPRDSPGTETYYQVASAASKRLAGLVYEEVVRALGRNQVAWVADRDAGAKYRLNGRGGDYYGVLRRTVGVPAVIVESAFLSNGPEAELLARSDVREVEADAIARGVVRFLTTRDPGSGFVTPYPRREPTVGGGAEGCVDPPL